MEQSNPSPENIAYNENALSDLKQAYKLEQTKYLERQIDYITNAINNQKTAAAWKVMNEISGKKSCNSSKLKASSQKELVQLWQKYFKNLLGNQPKITDNEITPVFTELNIKKGPFTMEELLKAVKSIKYGKACGLDEIPVEIWKLKEFHEILLECCNSVYQQEVISSWRKGCILLFPKKGNLNITKNYRGITLTAISAKIYNLMLLNRIRPAVDPLLRKNQNGFRSKRSTMGQILTIRRILEGVRANNLPAVLLFIDFSKAFDSIHHGKMRDILIAYGIPQETVDAIMMLYQDTCSMVRSPDGNTEFFDIIAGVLQGDTLAPYIFIICLDYVLRRAID